MPRTAGLTIEVDWSAEKVKKGLADLNAMFKGGLSVGGDGVLKSVDNGVKSLQKSAGGATGYISQLNREIKSLENESVKLAYAGKKNTETFDRITSSLNAKKAALAEAKGEVRATDGAYQRMAVTANALTRKANDLGAALGIDAQEFKDASKAAKEYTDKLKAIDGASGRNFRNVGNYAGSLQGISNSLNQITREFPAFANSVQTGFMAISNNIPMFIDQLTAIKTQNKELIAQGKPTVSAFKTIASAIFSWQTALSLGVTLLTVYGAKIWESIKGVDLLAEAKKRQAERQKELNQIEESAFQQAGKNIGQVKSLLAVLENENATNRAKAGTLKKLQDMYPTTLGHLDMHDVKSGKLAQTINTVLIPAIEAEGRVMALNDKIANNYGKRIDLKYKQIKAEKEYGKALSDANAEEAKNNANKDVIGTDFATAGTVGESMAVIRARRKQAEAAKVYRDIRYETIDVEKENTFLLNEQKANIGDLNKAAAAGLSGFKDTATYLKKAGENGKTVADAIKEVNKDLSGLETRKESNLIGEFEYLEEKSKVLASGIKKLTEDFGVKPGNNVLAAWAEQARVTNVELRTIEMTLGNIRTAAKTDVMGNLELWRDGSSDNRLKKLSESIQGPDIGKILGADKVPEEVKKFIEAYNRGQGEINKNIEAQRAKLAEIISQSIEGGLSGLGEAIGGALAGMENPFNALLGFLGQAIKDFGKYLIQLGGVREVIDKAVNALSISGAPAIIAGVAAVGIGTYLQSLANKKGKQSFRAFADGGVLYGPTMSLMGEYPGVANNPEVVAPLNKLKDLMGNTGAQVFIPETRIDGRDLVILYKRAEKFNNR